MGGKKGLEEGLWGAGFCRKRRTFARYANLRVFYSSETRGGVQSTNVLNNLKIRESREVLQDLARSTKFKVGC